jgi:hypothetical protein
MAKIPATISILKLELELKPLIIAVEMLPTILPAFHF